MTKKNRVLWPLPLLFVLWSNLHGGYSFGFMLLGITLVGMIFDRLFRPESDETESWQDIGRLADWTAISLLAVLINPNGINTWKIPFQTVGVEVTKYIQEWESLDFHLLSNLPYLVLLFGCLISIGLSVKKARGSELAGLTLFGISSLTAQRLVGIFALFAAVVLARHLDGAILEIKDKITTSRAGNKLRQSQNTTKPGELAPGIRRIINLSLAGIFLAIGIVKVYYVSQPAVVNTQIASYYPVQAVDYLLDSGRDGNIFSDYGWGGYLDWRLRDNKVFIDGRADLYSDALFHQWLEVVQAKPNWETILADYDVHLILLPPEMPVVEAAEQTGWQVLHRNETSVLLTNN
jgi:hypothetical protein